MKLFGRKTTSILCAAAMLLSSLVYFAYAEKASVSVSKELTASDGKTYEITVAYEVERFEDGSADFPENAELRVAELTAADLDASDPKGTKGGKVTVARSVAASASAASAAAEAPVSDGEQPAAGSDPADGFALTYDEYVRSAARALDREPDEFTSVHVFDISLCDPVTGEELEPDRPVSVSVRLMGEEFEGGERSGVVHFGEQPEVLDSVLNEGTVEFETDGFSVYVVVSHEGGDVVDNPRVEFHYIGSDYTESATDPGTYSSVPYVFVNKAGSNQVTQIVRDGEDLEMIANPPNKKNEGGDEATFFYGWYTVNMISDTTAWDSANETWDGIITYTWPDPQKVEDETPISIVPAGSATEFRVGESVTWSIGTASGTAVLDEEGTAHVYLVPLYADFYFINFHMGNKEAEPGLRNNLLTRRLLVFGTSITTTVRIGDVSCPSPDPAHLIFAGWETVTVSGGVLETGTYYATTDLEGGEITKTVDKDGNEIASAGTGYYITVEKSGSTLESVDLYPVFAEARWVSYKIGSIGGNGNGAVYVPSVYRLTNDDDKGTSLDSPLPTTIRTGFDFDGWYVNAALVDSDIMNLNGDYDLTVTLNGATTTTHYTRAIRLTNGSGAVENAVKGKKFWQDDPATESVTCGDAVPDGKKLLFEVDADGKIWFYKAIDELTLCAKWNVQPATYRVIIWKQKVTDDKNARDALKTYDYELFYTSNEVDVSVTPDLTRFSGSYMDDAGNTQTVNNINLLTRTYTGFHYSRNDVGSGTPNPNGTTVYNVYYDRDLRAINFYYNNVTPPVTYYSAYTFTVTTSNSGTQYGLVADQYMQLTYSGGVWKAPEYVYQYSVDNTNGMFGLVNGKYVSLTPVYEQSTVYALTTTLTEGNKYLIVSRNNAGSGYALGHNGTAVAADAVTVVSGSPVFIEAGDVDATSVWTAANGFTLKNGNYYISRSGGNLQFSTSSSNWSWSSNNSRLYQSSGNGWGSTTYYYIRYNNGWILQTSTSNASVYLYQETEISTLTGYTYDNNGTPVAYTGDRYSRSYTATGNQIEYTATRFTRSNNTLGNNYRLVTWSGLYGQSLAQNGYSWDTVSANYWREGTSGSSGTGQTFLDAFIQDDNPYNLGTNSSSGTFLLYHYRQQLDGTYTMDDREAAHLTLGSGSTTFNFTNKYNGFTVSSYNKGTNGFSSTGGSSSGSSTSISSSDRELHVYHTRNSYEFTFDVNYPVDASLTYSGGQSSNYPVPGGVLYEASLSSYGSSWTDGVTHWYYGVSDGANTADRVLKGPDHYVFKGWYEDKSGTVKFNFNSTMPAANKIVYAKWEPEEFLIKINPNGAEIDHIDHTGASYTGLTTPPTPLNREQVTYLDEDNNTVVERYADSGYADRRSTYFFGDYGETVGEYAVTRSYVPIGDTAAAPYIADGRRVYVYVNTQYLGGNIDGEWGVMNDLRNALYVDATYGTNQYKNDDPAQGETELYTLYKFYHDLINDSYIKDPGWWDCDDAKELSFAAWKNLFVDKIPGSNSLQLYRKCNGKENWVFLGWFKNDEAMPYNFSDPVEEAFTLTAKWRLDGGYTVRYTPEFYLENGDLINGYMEAWIDPQTGSSSMTYTDGAKTTIFKQPTNLTRNNALVTDNSLVFRGWRVVSLRHTYDTDGVTILTTEYIPLEDGVFYDPNDDFTINVQYADRNNVIHMQAVYEEIESSYRRPYVTNLTLDANSGYLTAGSAAGADPVTEELADDMDLGWSDAGRVTLDAAADKILFGDIRTSTPIHLYRYASLLTKDAAGNSLTGARNYFAHHENYFLLGFDDRSDEGDYVAAYPADSVIAVTRNDDKTVFAVWEPMVYLTFVNNATGPVTFSLTATDNTALEVINIKNGLYDREPLSNFSSVTIPKGETLKLAFPKGAEKDITVSGTNTLGVGQALVWNSSVLLDGETPTRYTTENTDAEYVEYSHSACGETHRLPKGEEKNTFSFSFTERLISNSEPVTVTFSTRHYRYAMVLRDNWNGDGTGGGMQEFDYSDEDIAPEGGVPKSQLLPSTSTRMAYDFLGWAYSPTATEPDFSSTVPAATPWTVPDLNKDNGFFHDSVLQGETYIRELYAVWRYKEEASHVYVYKNVPDPGDQNKEFTFTFGLSATYTYDSENHTTNLSADGTFTLKHGESAELVSQNNTEIGRIWTVVTLYDAVGNVKKRPGTDEDWIFTVSAKSPYEYSKGSFHSTEHLWVTEDTYQYYDTLLTRLSQVNNSNPLKLADNADTTTNPLNDVAGDTVNWYNTFAGGTVIFNNYRKTKDVTVEKEYVGIGTAAVIFPFTASYTLDNDGVSKTVDLGSFTVTSGTPNTEALKDIPLGAVLTVAEGEDHDYITTVKIGSGAYAAGRTASFTVTDDTTVYYRNELISYPVRFFKEDQDRVTGRVEAFFNFSGPGYSIGTDLYAYAANNGMFYRSGGTSEPLYAGQTYTLKETWVQNGFEGLADEVTIAVSGEAGHEFTVSDSENVRAVFNSGTGTWDFYVKNQEIKEVTVVKALSDPLVSQRTFTFNYSYSFNGSNLSGTFTLTPVAGSQASKTVSVPVGATGLTITEDTSKMANETDTIAQTYDTTVKYKDGAASAGAQYAYASAVTSASSGERVTFTNTRKTVNVTVKKIVKAEDTSGEFPLTFTVRHGEIPIPGYTVYYGDPLDDSDDLVTNASGIVLPAGETDPTTPAFTLVHNGERTIKIPVGASVLVKENLTAAQAEVYAAFMTMPGVDIKLRNGKADEVEVIGPTEDKELRIYNIPSICKVTDDAENLLWFRIEGGDTPETTDDVYIPAIYSTIRDAFADIGKYFGKSGSTYTAYTDTTRHYQIQMLVDYEVPNTDVVEVPKGYNMTFTTASRTATDGYPFRSARPYAGAPGGVPVDDSDYRAVLTRVDGSTKAFFTVSTSGSSTPTAFTMSDLIIDGHGATLEEGVKGGCLTAYNSTVAIDNCIIYRFVADQGGAVYTDGESLTVTDTIFDTCSSSKEGNGNGGGGIRTEAKHFSARDCSFINCAANFQGGGVYHRPNKNPTFRRESSFTLTRCTFTNCHAVSSSGGAESVSTNVTVEGCTFTNCYISDPATGRNGGGINIYSDDSGNSGYASTASFTDCAFYGCGAETDVNNHGFGGGLRCTALTTTVTGCTFGDYVDDSDPANPVTYHNRAKYGGGAAVTNTASGSSATVSGCTFQNCAAVERGDNGGNGGGLYSTVNSLTVQDNGGVPTAITGCSAKSGGGVYTGGGLTVLGDTSINSCTASGNGGGIYDGSATPADISDTTLLNCSAAGGGGIYVKHASISGVTVDSCSATGNGGGVQVSGGTVSIGGSSAIQGCSAVNGSAIYVNAWDNNPSSLTLEGSTEIKQCTASSNGTVYINNAGSAVVMQGSASVHNCTASKGGGFYVSNGNLTVNAGRIYECQVPYGGGAVYMSNGTATIQGTAQVQNNTVENPTSTGTGNHSSGGAVYVDKGTLTVAGSAQISGNRTVRTYKDGQCLGGAIYVKDSTARVYISGGTIENNRCSNTSDCARGGAVYMNNGEVSITGGTIRNNSVSATGTDNNAGLLIRDGQGGGVYINAGTLRMSGGSLTGNTASGNRNANGGAVFVNSGTVFELSGGTISGNTVTAANASYASVAKGAGIYLTETGTLNLSGNPSFGGADTDDTCSFSSGAGNRLTTDITATNGGKTYTRARQDIYVAGYGSSDVASLVVDGALTGAKGSIWVWPEQSLHIHKEEQFALITASNPGNLGVFRDARTDTDSGATAEALYGIVDPDNDGRVIWGLIGGVDIFFRKTDGSGSALSGASFRVYDTYAHAAAGGEDGVLNLKVPNGTGGEASATSALSAGSYSTATVGTDTVEYNVTFKINTGTFWLKETAAPSGYNANTSVYKLTVNGLNDFTIERMSDASTVDATLDVATGGIVNYMPATRKVILRKVNNGLEPLTGARFDILRVDMTAVATDVAAPEANGIFWIGGLPMGTYYLHETEVPAGYQKLAGTNDNWFRITVTEAGVSSIERLNAAP